MTATDDPFESDTAVDLYRGRASEGFFPVERKAVERHLDAPGATVLDLGCATGRTTRPLEDLGFDVTGLDRSRPLVSTGRELDPDLDLLVGDARRLPFRAGSFGYVLFSYYGLDYLHPAAARREALREIHRVLAPGGLFLYSSHNWWSALPSALLGDTGALDLLRNRERPLDPRDRYARLEVTVGETVVYVSSPRQQRRQLQRCGFELVDVVGKRDGPSRYLERAPMYVARKPP